MKLSPTLDNVIIRPATQRTKSPGGITLPESARRDDDVIGTVVATGRGAFEHGVFVEVTVKPGNQVVLERHRGLTEVDVDGERLLIVSASAILAVLVAD